MSLPATSRSLPPHGSTADLNHGTSADRPALFCLVHSLIYLSSSQAGALRHPPPGICTTRTTSPRPPRGRGPWRLPPHLKRRRCTTTTHLLALSAGESRRCHRVGSHACCWWWWWWRPSIAVDTAAVGSRMRLFAASALRRVLCVLPPPPAHRCGPNSAAILLNTSLSCSDSLCRR